MDTEVTTIQSDGNAGDCRITIVASRYNNYVVDRLMHGALQTLNNAGVQKDSIRVVYVPGAYEIPVAVKKVISSGGVDAVITLGAVIRGETPHFDIIANECARGIGSIAIETGIPVVFGVLTVDNVDQAMDRSGDEESNKGSEAAQTAIDMLSVFRQVD